MFSLVVCVPCLRGFDVLAKGKAGCIPLTVDRDSRCKTFLAAVNLSDLVTGGRFFDRKKGLYFFVAVNINTLIRSHPSIVR